MIPDANDMYTKFGLAILAAFLGSVARSRLWFFPDDMKRPDGSVDPRAGKFNKRRCFTEISTSFALGMVAAGIGEYLHCPPTVMGGLAAALGLVGGACAGELAESFVKGLANRLAGGRHD